MTCRTLLIAGLAVLAAQAQSKPPAPGKSRLQVLYTASAFRGNRADFEAAAKVWMQMVAQRRGFQVDSQLELASPEEIRRRAQESSVDMVILDTLEYLGLSRLGLFEPVVTCENDSARQYVLIARNDGVTADIGDLRGKRINFWSATGAGLGRVWLEAALHDRKLGRAQTFFGSVSEAAKASSACLPVYFGTADACVVKRASWELLKEMNPQMGNRLKIVASSPPLVELVACLHVNFKQFRTELLQAMLDLHRDPQGTQLLLVFKAERLSPISARDLGAVRELWAKYSSFALPARAARTAGPRVEP